MRNPLARHTVIRHLAAIALALAVALGAPAMASASSATVDAQAVAALNALRAEVGVPPVTEQANLDADCAVHARWMAANNVISHEEPSSDAGSTTLGQDTGESSVLSWVQGGVPQTSVATIHWLYGSPLHLSQLLDPGLQNTGYDFEAGYACMVTNDIPSDPNPDAQAVFDGTRGVGAVYTWPPNGATGVPVSEDTTHEEPSPNTAAGLPQAQLTGPWLQMFATNSSTQTELCEGTTYTSFSITGPAGAVAVHKYDEGDERVANGIPTGSDDGCLTPFGGGMIVADHPLAPSTTYTASITYQNNGSDPGTPQTHSWTFTTQTLEQATPVPTVTFAGGELGTRGSQLSYTFRLLTPRATRCAAKLSGTTLRCSVKKGRITLSGTRSHHPSSLTLLVTVKDRFGRAVSFRHRFRA